MTAYSWVLRQARLVDGRPVDIGLDGARIAAVAPQLPGQGRREMNLAGQLVLPAFVDPHVHLDKTHSLGLAPNLSGTLTEAIASWGRLQHTLDYTSYLERACWGLEQALMAGTTALRTHVDLEPPRGLLPLQALLEARQRFADRMDIQIVVLGFPGRSPQDDALLEAALHNGADVVGGCPAITAQPQATLEAAFQLALRLQRPLDLHIDEFDDPAVFDLPYLAQRSQELGLQGRVVAGHCCSLDFQPPELRAQVIDLLAQADLSVVSLPACNLNLQGRGRWPMPRGLTPIGQLLDGGVRVMLGSDNVQDVFNPVGNYDPLFAAQLAVLAAHLTSQAHQLEVLHMITTYPAQALQLPSAQIAPGAPANLVVLQAAHWGQVLAQPPIQRRVFARGRLVAHTQYQVQLAPAQQELPWT